MEKIAKKYRWILAVIIILVLLYPSVVQWSGSNRIELPIITKYENIKKCKKMVLEHLKAPSTAIFSNIEYEFTDKMDPYDYSVDENSEISKRRKSYFGEGSGNNTFGGGTGSGYSGYLSIYGNVESENSFGAMVIGPFSCKKTQGENMVVDISN